MYLCIVVWVNARTTGRRAAVAVDDGFSDVVVIEKKIKKELADTNNIDCYTILKSLYSSFYFFV